MIENDSSQQSNPEEVKTLLADRKPLLKSREGDNAAHQRKRNFWPDLGQR